MAAGVLLAVSVHAAEKKDPVPVGQAENLGEEQIAELPPTRMNKKEQIEFSRQDLAQRLGLDLEEVKLSGAIQVTWRSGAVGCPQPDGNYIDALVPGVLIMLKVGNKPYRYHALPGTQPFHCPDELAEPPLVRPDDA